MTTRRSDMDAGRLVTTYIKIRDVRNELKHKFDEKDAELKSQLSTIESALMESMEGLNVTSLKTDNGTVFRTTKTRYWAPDWDAFKTFALENDAVDLFERRIHQSNMKDFLAENAESVPPIAADSRYSVTVRRGK
jgi:hypothetical protein